MGRIQRRLIAFILFPAAALLGACGGGGGGTDSGQPPPPVQPVNYNVSGEAVVKVRHGAAGVVVLQEKPAPLMVGMPERRITLLPADGGSPRNYTPPTGWWLLDFALHPSGNVSALLANEKSLRLVRLDRLGAVLHDQMVDDPQAATDPIADDYGVFDSTSLLPRLAKDTARLAPMGEDLALVARTGRHATVAWRYNLAATGYARAWRTLVEPGAYLGGRFLTSGSYDTFAQLINHFQVFADTDAGGQLMVAVVHGPFDTVLESHNLYFNESLPGTMQGALVTRVSAQGQRLGTTAVDTVRVGEVHGLRASGTTVALTGRVRTERRADGTGWDAFAAVLGQDGALQQYRVIDVNQGDILFDMVSAGNGRWLAAGATGYVQNPAGASISDITQPLLLELNADASVRQRLTQAAGPRQNQLRSLDARGTNWLLGGLQNGPGTHSADADLSLITADGFVREITHAP